MVLKQSKLGNDKFCRPKKSSKASQIILAILGSNPNQLS